MKLLITLFIVAVIILAADIVLESYWSWNVQQANKVNKEVAK